MHYLSCVRRHVSALLFIEAHLEVMFLCADLHLAVRSSWRGNHISLLEHHISERFLTCLSVTDGTATASLLGKIRIRIVLLWEGEARLVVIAIHEVDLVHVESRNMRMVTWTNFVRIGSIHY